MYTEVANEAPRGLDYICGIHYPREIEHGLRWRSQWEDTEIVAGCQEE